MSTIAIANQNQESALRLITDSARDVTHPPVPAQKRAPPKYPEHGPYAHSTRVLAVFCVAITAPSIEAPANSPLLLLYV